MVAREGRRTALTTSLPEDPSLTIPSHEARVRGSAEKSTFVCARTDSGVLSSTFAPISYTFNLASLQAT